jgi:hypothetical protein
MVDVDSAKSKRDFKRMSNLMLDKEKGLVRSFRTVPMRTPLALTQLVCIPPGFQEYRGTRGTWLQAESLTRQMSSDSAPYVPERRTSMLLLALSSACNSRSRSTSLLSLLPLSTYRNQTSSPQLSSRTMSLAEVAP